MNIDRPYKSAWIRGRDKITAVLGVESPKRVTITIPNYLTITRLVIVPIFWYLYFSGKLSFEIAATLLFAFGAITDLFDGKLARRLGQETAFGDFMDPLVDKILVLAGFWALYVRIDYLNYTAIAFVLIVLITTREIALTLMRIWAIGGGSSVITSAWGKWKTGIQLTTILFAMVAYNVQDILINTGVWLPLADLIQTSGFTVLLVIMLALSTTSSLASAALYFRGTSFRRSDAE